MEALATIMTLALLVGCAPTFAPPVVISVDSVSQKLHRGSDSRPLPEWAESAGRSWGLHVAGIQWDA